MAIVKWGRQRKRRLWCLNAESLDSGVSKCRNPRGCFNRLLFRKRLVFEVSFVVFLLSAFVGILLSAIHGYAQSAQALFDYVGLSVVSLSAFGTGMGVLLTCKGKSSIESSLMDVRCQRCTKCFYDLFRPPPRNRHLPRVRLQRPTPRMRSAVVQAPAISVLNPSPGATA